MQLGQCSLNKIYKRVCIFYWWFCLVIHKRRLLWHLNASLYFCMTPLSIDSVQITVIECSSATSPRGHTRLIYIKIITFSPKVITNYRFVEPFSIQCISISGPVNNHKPMFDTDKCYKTTWINYQSHQCTLPYTHLFSFCNGAGQRFRSNRVKAVFCDIFKITDSTWITSMN